MRLFRFLPVALLAVLGVAPAAQASHAHGGASVQVIASGLDSPRHLAFGSGGDLYVAEAGRGGSGPCFIGGEGPACMGASGAVTRIDRSGNQSRIAEGLASYANQSDNPAENNHNAIGPHGITVLGRHTVLITNGGPTEPREFPADPTDPHSPPGPTISREALAEQNPVADLFGRVLLLRRHGDPVSIADIYDFERDVNPDAAVGNPAVDSNPVDVELDGRKLVVVDAGGNALDVVRRWGRVSNLAVFPNDGPVPNPMGGPDIPFQAVPTAVAVGRDAYYVSQLTGFPFPVGAANIFRVDKRTGAVSVFASGFTNLMDLAWGRDGTLYALEIAHNGLLSGNPEGAIYAVSRDGSKRQLELPAGTLTAPGGIAVGDHALYVTNKSTEPGGGEVLRIRAR
jgi:hypothetical protein